MTVKTRRAENTIQPAVDTRRSITGRKDVPQAENNLAAEAPMLEYLHLALARSESEIRPFSMRMDAAEHNYTPATFAAAE